MKNRKLENLLEWIMSNPDIRPHHFLPQIFWTEIPSNTLCQFTNTNCSVQTVDIVNPPDDIRLYSYEAKVTKIN